MEKSSNEIKAEIMLEELKLKYQNINGADSDENIIKKIIELNFDENAISNFYDNVKIYKELEEEMCSGLGFGFDEEMIKEKIKESNFDKEKIIDWIENQLLGED